MASNNVSRERRRVRFEEDSDASSERGRVDGRDGEEYRGPSLGRMNEGLSYGARGDDVSTRHVGGATRGDFEGSRREGSGPRGQDAGRTRDGRQGEERVPQASASQTIGDGTMVVMREADVLSYVRMIARGGAGVNGRDEDDVGPPAGPHQRWPIGTLTAQAALGLATGRAPTGSLDAFITHNISYEVAMSNSSRGQVWAVHTPVMLPPPLVCDICNHDGTHNTGHCAMVTSDRHGDTNADPFCDCSSSRARDRHGKATHGLQRSQNSGAAREQIVCTKLAAHWEQGELGVLFQKFVVERRRMPPLLVHTKAFCFIRLAIAYSNAFCEGEMPEALEGIWPYTKADALRHKNRLRQFYERGMENMPAGELEGLSMADIRARYDTRGGIMPQCRQT